MPIPTPREKEKSKDFISRCMANDTMNKEYPDNEQRAGICYSALRKKRGKSKLERLL